MATSVSAMAKVVRTKARTLNISIPGLLCDGGISYRVYKDWLKIDSIGSKENQEKMDRIIDYLSTIESIRFDKLGKTLAPVA